MAIPQAPESILIVDDSDDDYEVLSRSFKKVGVANSLVRCVDGQDALDYLYQKGKYEKLSIKLPNLILLDLNMPGIDGKGVLKQIKNDPHLKSIPVIICTTSILDKDIQDCYQLGANSFMSKPSTFDSYIEAIKRLKEFVFEINILPSNII